MVGVEGDDLTQKLVFAFLGSMLVYFLIHSICIIYTRNSSMLACMIILQWFVVSFFKHKPCECKQ